MSTHIVDLVLVIAALVSIFRGLRAGFIASVLALIGFAGGGLLGLVVGLKYLNDWTNVFGKFAALLVAISIGSSVGEWLLKKFAKFFHKKMLFGPFRWLDSLLGAAFSLLRTTILLYLVIALLLATPWTWPHKNIPDSKIYQRVEKLTPGIVKSVTKQIKSIN